MMKSTEKPEDLYANIGGKENYKIENAKTVTEKLKEIRFSAISNEYEMQKSLVR